MGKEKRLNINMKIYRKIGILIIWTIFCYFIYAWITQTLGNFSMMGYVGFIRETILRSILGIVFLCITLFVILREKK
jgi:hypothetical protein